MVKYTFNIRSEYPGQPATPYVLSPENTRDIGEIINGFVRGRVATIDVSGGPGETFDPMNSLLDVIAAHDSLAAEIPAESHVISIAFHVPIRPSVDGNVDRREVERYGDKLLAVMNKFNYYVVSVVSSITLIYDQTWMGKLNSYIHLKKTGRGDPMNNLMYRAGLIGVRHNPGEARKTVIYDGKEKPLTEALKSFLYKNLNMNQDLISVTWDDRVSSDASVNVTIYYQYTDQSLQDALHKKVTDLAQEFERTIVTTEAGYQQFKALYEQYYTVNIANLKTHLRSKVQQKVKDFEKEEAKAASATAGGENRERDRDAPATLRASSEKLKLVVPERDLTGSIGHAKARGLEFTDVELVQSEISTKIEEYVKKSIEEKARTRKGRSLSVFVMINPEAMTGTVDIEWSPDSSLHSFDRDFSLTQVVAITAIFCRLKNFIVSYKGVDYNLKLEEFKHHLYYDSDGMASHEPRDSSSFWINLSRPENNGGVELEDIPYVLYFHGTDRGMMNIDRSRLEAMRYNKHKNYKRL